MLKWFSVSGIKKEVVGRIRWPKISEMVSDSKTVISFIVAFVIFFVLSDLFVAIFLQLIGLGAS